jgi:hypothetical protein
VWWTIYVFWQLHHYLLFGVAGGGYGFGVGVGVARPVARGNSRDFFEEVVLWRSTLEVGEKGFRGGDLELNASKIAGLTDILIFVNNIPGESN